VTPTARSLAWLRREGFVAVVVERWLPHANLRSDLWRFADLLAAHPRERIFLLVQSTSIANVASRVRKARSCPELRAWTQAGGTVEVHGWQKRGPHWELKRVAIQAEDLVAVTVQTPPRRRRAGKQATLFDP